MRFICVFNLQLIDEVVGEFYVRLSIGSLTVIVGILVGILQWMSGDVTVRSVYTIITGNVKGKTPTVCTLTTFEASFIF